MTELRRCSQQLGWLESYENPGKRWRFFMVTLQGRTWPQKRLFVQGAVQSCLLVHLPESTSWTPKP